MTVCARYARSDEETEEMVDDAFIRVFTKIDQFNISLPFRPWLHTILIRSALNYLKKYQEQLLIVNLTAAQEYAINDDMLAQISAKEIINLIRRLPPSFRATFNLYVVEGYQHSEIAEALHISESTSRSNLLIARRKLKELLLLNNKIRI